RIHHEDEREGDDGTNGELPRGQEPRDRREDHNRRDRRVGEENLTESLEEELHRVFEEVEEGLPVLLQPPESGVDPFTERKAGEEVVFRIHLRSPPVVPFPFGFISGSSPLCGTSAMTTLSSSG